MSIKELLDIVLKDKGIKKSKGDYAWFSPFTTHYKRKLEIQIDPDQPDFQCWHCWITNKGGKTIYSLFKELNVKDVYIEELKKLGLVKKHIKKEGQQKQIIELPKEYVFLGDRLGKQIYTAAFNYLKTRKCTTIDIYRYRIGYCLTGEYADCIIIPSYDEDGILNYFIGKNIYTGQYSNPPISKNIVFDSFLINWHEPLLLVEGFFDLIAIKTNATLLLGKTLNDELKLFLIKNKPPKVFIVLDGDATKQAYEVGREIAKLGIETHITKLKDNKDPNDLGHEKVIDAINTQSVHLTYKENVIEKLSRI